MHGEEVWGVVEFFDEGEFVVKVTDDLGRHTIWIAIARTLPGEVAKMGHGGLAGRDDLVGIFVAELVEGEAMSARCKIEGTMKRGGVFAIEAINFVRGFEVALGIWVEVVSGLGKGAGVTNASENILQHAALRDVVVNIGCGDQRHPTLATELGIPRRDGIIIEGVGMGEGEGKTIADGEKVQGLERVRGIGMMAGVQHENGEVIRGVGGNVGDGEVTFTFRGAAFADGEEAAELAIGRHINGV
jgi:hypothetical protein